MSLHLSTFDRVRQVFLISLALGIGFYSAHVNAQTPSESPQAAQPANAEAPVTTNGNAPQPATASPAASSTTQTSLQHPTKLEPSRHSTLGPLYHPDGPGDGRFRASIGMLWDAIDPAAVMGFNAAVPQLLSDMRLGLSNGFSLQSHINTMLVSNEIEIGAAWKLPLKTKTSVMASLLGGVLFGKLSQFEFDTFAAAPVVRPSVTVGHPFGNIMLSFRADAVIALMQYIRLGSTSISASDISHFTAGMLSVTVENKLSYGGMWFFGASAMFARAYYQAWVLFSDNPSLMAYPRIFGGYEF